MRHVWVSHGAENDPERREDGVPVTVNFGWSSWSKAVSWGRETNRGLFSPLLLPWCVTSWGPNGKITSPSRPGSSLDPSHVIIAAPAGVIKHVCEIPGMNGGFTVENPSQWRPQTSVNFAAPTGVTKTSWHLMRGLSHGPTVSYSMQMGLV
jgi:hypothetical protein